MAERIRAGEARERRLEYEKDTLRQVGVLAAGGQIKLDLEVRHDGPTRVHLESPRTCTCGCPAPTTRGS